MRTLFWKTDEPCEALEKESIQGMDNQNQESADWFLHGICGIFALVLNETFGYPIEIAAEENIEGLKWEDRVVHIYCRCQKYYIDVRGITDDEESFFDEFGDFLTGNDDEFFELSHDELVLFLREEMSDVTLQYLCQSAAALIEKYKDGYQIRKSIVG